jgi:hypothetical protein
MIKRVDIDVVRARIMRGFGGEFEAAAVDKMARSLILGEPLTFIYNDQEYKLVANAKRS